MPKFLADLHIHSHYSRATSKDLTPEQLWIWAQKKGITVVATGDFTHPGWLEELEEKLVQNDNGLLELKPEIVKNLEPSVPKAARRKVYFVLSAEISNIYKHNDKLRKVHNVVLAPSFEAVKRFNAKLSKIGNLVADGRPILGITSKQLLEIALETIPQVLFIPAHVWTPWFSLFGSRSGYDSIDECFEELTEHIFALETGLSSDPPMNWRVSANDRFRLVSNSDAHSPSKLGRESNLFETELSYFAIYEALRTGKGFWGTVEFFPEEGKYHLDGHRKCGVKLTPKQTRELNGRCPVCGEPLTVGVLHRVEELADREEGVKPPSAKEFLSLIPLPEVIAEIQGRGVNTKGVKTEFERLLNTVGDEFTILTKIPLEDIRKYASALLAEAINRMRQGKVIREAGFDGEYGTIRVFPPEELEQLRKGGVLFAQLPQTEQNNKNASVSKNAPKTESAFEGLPLFSAPQKDGKTEQSKTPDMPSYLATLDEPQRQIVISDANKIAVVAGPGTGKTRVLISRLLYRFDNGLDPYKTVVITFTRKAANEIKQRLQATAGYKADKTFVGTFHAFGLALIKENPADFGLNDNFSIASEPEIEHLLTQVAPGLSNRQVSKLLSQIEMAKQKSTTPLNLLPTEARSIAENLFNTMQKRNLIDLQDLLLLPVKRLENDKTYRQKLLNSVSALFVDEYQDVNPIQHRFVELIALEPRNTELFVIGDPMQCIYAFRGSSPPLFESITQNKSVALFELKRNFRSSGKVVSVANAISGASLESSNQSGSEPLIYAAPTERAEAEFIAHTIERLIGGVSYFSLDSGRSSGVGSDCALSDIAILVRTRSQMQPIAEALLRLGLPVRSTGGTRPYSDTSLAEVIAVLRRWIAGESVDNLPKFDASMPLLDAVVPLLDKYGVERSIKEAFVAVASNKRANQLNLAIEELLLLHETDSVKEGADAVHLLTMHAAKGLEFPVVFIAGVEDGLIPIRGATNKELQEELRLFYVAATRAKYQLILTWSKTRTVNGKRVERTPSRFLSQIKELISEHKEARKKKKQQRNDPTLPFL